MPFRHSDVSWGMPSIKLKTEPEAATLTTKDKAEGDILKDTTEDETLKVVSQRLEILVGVQCLRPFR